MPYEIIRPITLKDTKDFINKYHKTGKGTNAVIPIRFGLYTNNKLRGIATYGTNLSAGATAKVLFNRDDLKDSYVDNLRLILLKPKTGDTYDNNNKKLMQPSAFVSFCDKTIFKYRPEIKFIVAYGSGIHGFNGTIYQSANYDYTGMTDTNFWWLPSYGLISYRNMVVGGRKDKETIKKAHPDVKTVYSVNFRYIKFRDNKTKKELMENSNFSIIPNNKVPKKEDIPTRDDTGKKYEYDYFRKNQIAFMPYFMYNESNIKKLDKYLAKISSNNDKTNIFEDSEII